MRAPLIVVTGTGTEIGKTHVTSALARAWGTRARIAAIKPVETGMAAGAEGEDAARLRASSTFHVKHWPLAPFVFEPPVSPHLAARQAGARISLEPIRAFVEQFADADGVLVELAGGLFSPLGDGLANVDVAVALEPTGVVLVASDRLGVLHDVGAATIAARACGLPIAAVVLSPPSVPDASTGRNAAELRYVCEVDVVAAVTRAPAEELATSDAINRVLRTLLAPKSRV
jgi:dethiobiotin synthetase